MSERRVYHVRRGTNQAWHVVKEGFKRPHIIRESREEAIRLAKRLAKVAETGKVVIHSTDNAIESQLNYGGLSVPEPQPGSGRCIDGMGNGSERP